MFCCIILPFIKEVEKRGIMCIFPIALISIQVESLIWDYFHIYLLVVGFCTVAVHYST